MPPSPPRSSTRARMSSLPAYRPSPSIGARLSLFACLTYSHVVELGELREQVVGHVRTGALRDVVEHDRPVGGAADLAVVRHDPAAVGTVVIRVDRQQSVDAELARRRGQVDGVARVVGADAGDDRRALGTLGHRERDHAEVLLVGERRRLPRGAADDEAVRAVGVQVRHEGHERLLVDGAVRVKRRDDGGEDGSELRHEGQYRRHRIPSTSRARLPRRDPRPRHPAAGARSRTRAGRSRRAPRRSGSARAGSS